MSASRLEGGLLDGAEIAEHREAFIYVSVPTDLTRKPRVHAKPRSGSLLYRLVGATYFFAGYRYGPCSGCGAFVQLREGERRKDCDLCGSPVRRIPVAR